MGYWLWNLGYHFEWLIQYVWNWIRYTITWNQPMRDLAWYNIGRRLSLIAGHIWSGFQTTYNAAVDWASPWITDLVNGVRNIWNSITSVWSRFGADLLDTAHTVVSWVTQAANNVWYWVLDRYEESRTWALNAWNWVKDRSGKVWSWIQSKSGPVWDWISSKANVVWEWISNTGSAVWDWISGPGVRLESWEALNAAYYEGLRETHGNRLLAFLQDPGGFILEYILDSIEWLVSEIVYRYW